MGSVVAGQVGQRKQKPVTRARRPQFSQKDWEGIFFKNLFKEGLVGPRPENLASPSMKSDKVVDSAAAPKTNPDAIAWSTQIDRAVLEDEVKRLQILLNEQVTTPAKFKLEHNAARQTFSLLSMTFGIISQYDKDVRWKDEAGSVQLSCARAAANARTGSQQSYAFAKRVKEDIAELVRGGAYPALPDVQPITDWSNVIDRGSIMQRLESAMQERLKEPMANANAFRGDAESVLHESNLIAAMGRILGSPQMMDTNDASYVKLAGDMSSVAQSLSSAVRNNDFESASKNLNLIYQSCDACHDEWR